MTRVRTHPGVAESSRPSRPGRRCLAAVAITSAVVITIAGCASSNNTPVAARSSTTTWSGIVSAANTEGVVNLYSANSALDNNRDIAAFNKEYPKIKVVVLHDVAAQIEQRADTEQKTGASGADVIETTELSWVISRGDTAGYFLPIKGPDANGVGRRAGALQPNGTTLLTNLYPYGFAWNAKEVSGNVTLTDLTQPRFKGKLGAYDFETGANLVVPYMHLSEDHGDDFLKGIAANQPQFYPSALPLAQAMEAGEVDAAVIMNPSSLAGLPDLKLGYDKRPFAIPSFLAVASWARHPSAAQVFVNWSMTQQGQEAFASGTVAALPKISTARFSASQVDAYTAADYQPQNISDWLNKLKTIFNH